LLTGRIHSRTRRAVMTRVDSSRSITSFFRSNSAAGADGIAYRATTKTSRNRQRKEGVHIWQARPLQTDREREGEQSGSVVSSPKVVRHLRLKGRAGEVWTNTISCVEFTIRAQELRKLVCFCAGAEVLASQAVLSMRAVRSSTALKKGPYCFSIARWRFRHADL